MAKEQVDFPNVRIQFVKIIKKGATYDLYNEEEFKSNPDAFSGISVENIVFDENMFGGPVSGYIEINDSIGLLEQINFNLYDSIQFFIDGRTFNFSILDYTINDNIAKKQIHGPSGIKTSITLRFISDTFMYREFDVPSAMSNFIGKISKDEKNTDENFQNIDYPDLVTLEEEKKMKGFIQEIIKKSSGTKDSSKAGNGGFGSESPQSGKSVKADPTYNDIWLKSNPLMYPFSKLSNNSRPFEIINYLCEYACWKKDPNRVDFFFWEDLSSWNFRSIAALVEEQAGMDLPLYDLDENEHYKNSIIIMNIINDSNVLDLLDKGCFFSEYIRTKPNWSYPYRHVVDTATSLNRKNVTFNYIEDIKTGLIERNTIAPEDVLRDIKDNELLNYSNVRMSDTLFGFHSAPYNMNPDNFSWWNYYNFYADGFTGERMARVDKTITELDLIKNEPDLTQISRLEKEYWQSQFDFCELPGAILNIIYKEIKYPLITARYNYAKLKNLKNSWISYKKNVCCERTVPSNFFALLIGADKIYGGTGGSYEIDSGGIYAYKWVEIEFWPKKQLENSNKVEFWKQNKAILEFEDSNFPFVFIMPSYALVGNNSEKYVVPGGITGAIPGEYDTPDNRAYNLNEILNSVAPIAFEDGTSYKTILMNPGVTDVLGNVVDRTTVTNYPSKTIMMPVGKFRIISETCPDFSQSGTKITSEQQGNNAGGFYFGGRIVQMTAIPKEILQSFVSFYPGITATSGISGTTVNDYLFVFDTVNAHDGLCNDENCT